MAASSNPNNNKNDFPSVSSSSPAVPSSVFFEPSSTPNTTFVQADPSTFRSVVQRLTGATHDLPTPNLPVNFPPRFAGKPILGEMGLRRPAFKLQERRRGTRKLEIKLGNGSGLTLGSDSPRQRNFSGFGSEMVMVSPVSPLDLFPGGSPRTPGSPTSEEEERVIAEKGFYLHPSPLNTPRGSDPPELLPLFPLRSPRTT